MIGKVTSYPPNRCAFMQNDYAATRIDIDKFAL
jgi:hypothetical protein